VVRLPLSVVILEKFEIGFRMKAGGAILKWFCTEMYITAFSAIPENFFIAFKYPVLHYIFQKFPVPFLMTFFSGGYCFKSGRNIFESFFISNLCK